MLLGDGEELNLPDIGIDDDTNEDVTGALASLSATATMPEAPAGHPPIQPGDAPPLTCPFAAIQMAIESKMASPNGNGVGSNGNGVNGNGLSPSNGNGSHYGNGNGVNDSNGLEMSSKGPTVQMSSRSQLSAFTKTSLDDEVIPEGKNEGKAAARSIEDIANQAAAKAQSRNDDEDGRSHVSSGQRSGAMKSKRSGRTGKSGSSRGSTSTKKKKMIPRRTRNAPTFSAWEAQTYIPTIKQSWQMVMSRITLDKLGMEFYDILMGIGGDALKSMFTTEKDIMAGKFAEMLTGIVTSVDDPYAIYQKLKGLAPMHLQKGVSRDHLPIMGNALTSMLEQVLGDALDSKIRAAWSWLWTWLSSTMAQTLEEAGNETSLVSKTWDLANDNYPEDQLGALLFDVLFEMAPNLKSIFNKPRQILSLKFVEMMSLLVTFQNRLDEDNEQLTWIGLRHIKYGAKRQHIEVLAQVLLATIERAVGDEWTFEMAESWEKLWTEACDKLLSITEEAEIHGERARELWDKVQQKTTKLQFGSSLRKKLLAGTEWVQSLSVGSQNGAPKEEPVKAADMTQGTFKDKSSDAEAIGNQFWEMLTETLDLLWEPEQQNEKLVIMTNNFFNCGIREAHLPTIGSAIETTSEKVMGAEWNEKYRAAWQWFWSIISKAMSRTLKVCEGEHGAVLRDSWAQCKAKKTTEELGDAIFKELARLAPHVVHLFKKPKRIQASQFVNATDMLISFADNPEQFFQDLRPLTIRHIKYGVKGEFSKAFGGAILNTVEKVLAPDFSAATKHSWAMLWNRASAVVTRALNCSTNLVIVSLANQDVSKMEEAMACTPRGERCETCCRVDVNGEVLSPLYWAIRDGMRDIALFLIEDLLAIRADRDTYYYGREKLFETHPDIVEVLCKDPGAVELMDTLFNGLIWHANIVQNGKLRVNYYIKELYGNPETEPNAWESALAVLSTLGPPEIFEHPVCIRLLQTKWQSFGLYLFVGTQFVYFLLIVGYFTTFVANGHLCDEWGTARLAVGSFNCAILLAQVIFIILQIRNREVAAFSISYPEFLPNALLARLPHEMNVPRFLMNAWNCIRIPACVLVAAATFTDPCLVDGNIAGRRAATEDGEVEITSHLAVAAVGAILLGLQLFEILLLVPSMAALTLLFRKLFADVFRTVAMILIIIAAVAGAMTILRAPAHEDYGLSIVSLIKMILANGNNHFDELDDFNLTLASILFIICQIGLLNMLVAQLVHASQETMQTSMSLVQKKIAYTCVEMESLLPLSYRQKLYDQLKFDEPLYFDASDDGPSGGISLIEPASVRSHPKYVPDRVVRITGEASPMDPWPREQDNYVEPEEQEE